MLIFCSRNFLSVLKKVVTVEHFCNNVKVLTVTFDQLIAFLLNKSISKERKTDVIEQVTNQCTTKRSISPGLNLVLFIVFLVWRNGHTRISVNRFIKCWDLLLSSKRLQFSYRGKWRHWKASRYNSNQGSTAWYHVSSGHESHIFVWVWTYLCVVCRWLDERDWPSDQMCFSWWHQGWLTHYCSH